MTMDPSLWCLSSLSSKSMDGGWSAKVTIETGVGNNLSNNKQCKLRRIFRSWRAHTCVKVACPFVKRGRKNFSFKGGIFSVIFWNFSFFVLFFETMLFIRRWEANGGKMERIVTRYLPNDLISSAPCLSFSCCPSHSLSCLPGGDGLVMPSHTYKPWFFLVDSDFWTRISQCWILGPVVNFEIAKAGARMFNFRHVENGAWSYKSE